MAAMAAESSFTIGERVRDEQGFAGTVRYIGSVASAKDQSQVYLGVEWDDDTRGKHDGSCTKADGTVVRHFACRPNAGSFVKPKKIRRGESFAEVMRRRYVSMDAAMITRDNKFDLEECNVKTSKGRALPIELHGELKIREKQQTGVLERVTCRNDMVALAGEDAGEVVPHLWLLDLQGNLLWNWQELARLVMQLPLLTNLRINGNRMSMGTLGAGVPAGAFDNLKLLVLNSCGLTSWAQVQLLETCLPAIQELSLAYNDLGDLEQVLGVPDSPAEDTEACLSDTAGHPGVPGFRHLRHLDLSNVGITSWRQVLRLAGLPELEELHLTDNGIEDVWPLPAAATADQRPLGRLRCLSLGGNQLRNWASIDALDSYKNPSNPAEGIQELRLGGRMPVLTGLGASEVRMITIARVPTITMLNGSVVKPKERVEAEKTYVRRVLRELMRTCQEQGTKTTETFSSPQEADVIARNPRFKALHEEHGSHVSASGRSGTGAIAQDMLQISLRSMAANSIEKDPVTKKLPSSFTVGKIKQLCKRLFDLAPELQVLYYETGDKQSGMVPNFLDDDTMSLGFFGVTDGATIFMNEVDLKQQQLEREAWEEEQLRREKEQEKLLTNFKAIKMAERGAELAGIQKAAQEGSS